MNKKLIVTIGLICLGVIVGWASWPLHSSVSTVDTDALDGSWSSFNWRWGESESQVVTVRVTEAGVPLSVGTTLAGCIMVRQDVTGAVTYLNRTNLTIATSNISFTVLSTSVPPAGSYLMEIYGFDTATNRRTYAQGKVLVYRNLY